MSIDTLIARMRAKEQKLWRSEGTLTRPSGTSSFNTTTGEETPDPGTQIYQGKCQVRPAERLGTDVQAGEREVRLFSLQAKFPANTAVEVDDVLVLSACDYDADLIGREFRVTDVPRDEWQVARLVMLEEVT